MIISRSADCPFCGDGHSNLCYVVYDIGYHCFSCGAHGGKAPEYYAYRPVPPVKGKKDLFIPECTFNVSEFGSQVLSWLYNYYIYDNDIKQARLGYCPAQAGKDESLLLPIFNDKDELVAYQRRFFPKNFFSSPDVKEQIFIVGEGGDTLCIVEDYISALRVGQHIPTLCLFGTSITTKALRYMLKQYKNCILWLDGDQPGINAAHKIGVDIEKEMRYNIIHKSYNNDSFTITNIRTERQPKEMSPTEIIKELKL